MNDKSRTQDRKIKPQIILLVLIIFLVSSCVPKLLFVAEEEQILLIDFVKYSEEGFYISPEKPNGNYIPISILDYHFIPEASLKKIPREYTSYDSKGNPNGNYSEAWLQRDLEVDKCIDTLVNFCKNLGADAIYNFELTPYDKSLSGILNPTTLRGIRITGFAVKREE